MGNCSRARLLSPIVRKSLLKVDAVRSINPTDPRDDLSFEINGIAQSAFKYRTDIELAREIAKYFNASFEGKFVAVDFVNAAGKILKAKKRIESENE